MKMQPEERIHFNPSCLLPSVNKHNYQVHVSCKEKVTLEYHVEAQF